MEEAGKVKKKDIQPSDIKANIYDSVEIIVDIHGITRGDIENVLQKLNEVLPAEKYSRADDSLSTEEVNAYGDRRDISLSISARKRYLDTENVIRYYSKDFSETITISRLFISIFLSYEIAHDLKSNINLMDKIIQVFNKLEYFEVEKVYLAKNDSIYCSSLFRMYQCFDRRMFGDTGYQLSFQRKQIDTGVVKVYNNFMYDTVEVILNKEIMTGNLADSEELVYVGRMNTIVAKEPLEDSISIEDILNELNKVSFEIFICHITDAFARDLVKGKSNKVRKGLNFYE